VENPVDARADSASGTEALTESLEELSNPLDLSEAEERPLPPGTRLAPEDEEPFTVVQLLEDGFPLRLYQATQDDNEETLWLWERTGESTSLLKNEGNLLRQVHCPMFPRVQADFTLDGRSYLATESCAGETLEEHFCAGKLDPSRAISILSQVAFALTKLHEAGFVHLGLRPAVIVPGRPTKILDFCDATRVGDTPARRFYHAGYTAPELLRDEPADIRSDIYSIGALLFHAVGGKPIAESGVELMTWEPEAPVAGVPQILSRCLGDKDTRYSSVADLHRDLVRLVKRLTPPVRYALGAATSIGLEPSRTTNQDAFTYCIGTLVCEEETESLLMACVADGMGGMEAGEAASGAAVRSVQAKAQAAFATGLLRSPETQVNEVKKWAHEANEGVLSALEKRKAKGGSTMVCACLVGNRLAVSHVGDCRIYLIRAGEAQLLTRDHSLAMALAMQGEIQLDDVRKHPERSRVTRSLGERRPMPDYSVDTLEQATGKPTMELEPGDKLLLCSDGVWEPLSDDELVSYITCHKCDLNAAADAIVQATLAQGGGDNATVVLVGLV
jgi:serine/threonine protein phosphatase PrpC